MASISTLLFSRKSIGTMQLTSSEPASLRTYLRLSNPMLSANPIFRFGQALKPWAAFTISSATIPCNLLTDCLMNFSPIYLVSSLRIFSTILFTEVQMTKLIIPIAFYLLSTPMITPIFFKQIADAGIREFHSSTNRQHHRRCMGPLKFLAIRQDPPF